MIHKSQQAGKASLGNSLERRRPCEVKDPKRCQTAGKVCLFRVHVHRFFLELDKEAGLGYTSLTLSLFPLSKFSPEVWKTTVQLFSFLHLILTESWNSPLSGGCQVFVLPEYLLLNVLCSVQDVENLEAVPTRTCALIPASDTVSYLCFSRKGWRTGKHWLASLLLSSLNAAVKLTFQ